uniref:Neogenin n=1 Tax=Oncorhynchus kisutch TaxID=8019 RepID=A0A8C7LID0_ONCKI
PYCFTSCQRLFKSTRTYCHCMAARPFSPFWFSVEPWDTLAVRGAPALLNCSAHSGDPASEPTAPQARVEWKKDGTFLSLAPDDGRRRVLPDGSLLISSVVHSKHNKPDEGTYQCVATIDSLGTIASRTARLTVAGMPRFSSQPEAASIRLGDSQVLACDVNPDLVPLARWEREREPLELSSRLVQLPNGALVVSNASEADAGLYRCMVENAGPAKTSEEAQLTILPELEFLVEPLPVTKVVGASLLLPCVVTGYPTPYVRWMVGDKLVEESEGKLELVGGGSLLIYNLTEEDAGVYSCMADITNNTIEAKAELTVQGTALIKSKTSLFMENYVTELFLVLSPPPTTLVQRTTLVQYTTLVQNRHLVSTSLTLCVPPLFSTSQDVDAGALSYTLMGLKKFTEYSIRVVAFNKHGSGVSTGDITVTTLSDVPSAPPQNLTVEVHNSKSIMVRWQPPPPGAQNGEITGYKIRYRKGTRKSEAAETTGGTQLFQLIDGLERGTEYTFRVSAITVNGSGPATEWSTAETFESDLDESRVPDIPSSLHVRPLVNSIVVSWTPPENQDMVVRGYTIGYGIGSPHAQTIKVDYKQRYYSIENLDPSSHYVITLKAFNNVGEGIPVYESAITRPQSDPDVDLYELFHAPYTPVPDPTPMLPPVGVQASVLSHDTIKVTWADNSLPKNQKITDARYYTVRWKTNIPANTKLKTANTTNLSHMVTGLKPNTLYEFSVMVTKGRRTSTWSMTAQGTTFETIPSSSPKDVTVVSKELKPRTIIVNWQPPSEANGKITGYIIYYSTDVNAEVHDWVIEPVVGNRLTHQIQELTLDTTYYFKIQARNSKGMGPMSEAVHFRTPKSKCGGDPWRLIGSESGDNHILVIVVIISVGAFTIIVVVVGAFLCTRRTTSHQKKKRAASKSSNSSHKYKGNSKDLKPPDLWIHHERLELKPIDKSPEPNPVMTDTPIPRTSQDINPVDPSLDNSLLQRRNSYRGHESEDSISALAGRRGMRPKMMMPFDTQPPQPVISAHPIHSLDNHHHHYHTGSLASPTRSYLHHHQGSAHLRPHVCATPISYLDMVGSTESVRNTPSTEPLPPQAQPPCQAEHQHPEPEGSYQDSTATDDEPSASGSYCSAGQPPTAHVRPTHPLKSFAVPANPAAIFESPALPSMPLLTQTGPQLHSVKTASIGTLGRVRPPMSVTVPSAPDVPETSKMLEDVDSSYEPDELTEEMAHLEDLMKDLNAITTA